MASAKSPQIRAIGAALPLGWSITRGKKHYHVRDARGTFVTKVPCEPALPAKTDARRQGGESA
jgi:hypothetical protein